VILEIFFICLIIGFILIEALDHWSTNTIFKYNDAVVNDTIKRNKFFDYVKQKGGTINELNPFARYFMKRFGFNKGMWIFTFSYNVPYFIVFFALIYFDYFPLDLGYVVLAFLIGSLYSQILKARTITKRCKILDVQL